MKIAAHKIVCCIYVSCYIYYRYSSNEIFKVLDVYRHKERRIPTQRKTYTDTKRDVYRHKDRRIPTQR